jgi:hypothetical protein
MRPHMIVCYWFCLLNTSLHEEHLADEDNDNEITLKLWHGHHGSTRPSKTPSELASSHNVLYVIRNTSPTANPLSIMMTGLQLRISPKGM